jgi:dynein intermediate chain
LEDLKKRRERRGQEDTVRVKAAASANLDEYIDGLLSQPGGSAETVKSKEEAPDLVKESSVEEDGHDAKSTQSLVSNVIAEAAAGPAPQAPPPKIIETFTVWTQTEDEDFPEAPDADQEDEEASQSREKPESQTQQNGVKHGGEKAVEEKDPKVLSSEEVEKEVSSQPFSSFINTASKKVERMLGTPILSDLLVDYIGEADDEKRSQNKDAAADKFVQSRQAYECKKWTHNRDVTDLDWSPVHRELILSTYHLANSTAAVAPLPKGSAAVSAVAPNDTLSSSLTPRSGELQSDGLALVWSLSMPSRPEHIFTCGSPVTSGRFHPTETTLVVGGCESGQLVVWDVRAGRLPVQKSALTTVVGASSKGHTHPIGSMEIIEAGVRGLGFVLLSGLARFQESHRSPLASRSHLLVRPCNGIIRWTRQLLVACKSP